MDDKTRALLGDHEAAKRLTKAGVLVPCPKCGGPGEVYKYPGEDWGQPYTAKCKKNDCDCEKRSVGCHSTCLEYRFWIGKDFSTKKQAIREWNTRAPILSAEEVEKIHEKENP